MGANVSRHSAKGLGRRSQSSGSICNGSGSGSGGKASRHPEGKICSSLPSYLDEREKNGTCNNNHERKHPLGEVRSMRHREKLQLKFGVKVKCFGFIHFYRMTLTTSHFHCNQNILPPNDTATEKYKQLI